MNEGFVCVQISGFVKKKKDETSVLVVENPMYVRLRRCWRERDPRTAEILSIGYSSTKQGAKYYKQRNNFGWFSREKINLFLEFEGQVVAARSFLFIKNL